MKSTISNPAQPTGAGKKDPVHFPVVAIGASAGGLEAMLALLKHLPHNTGMAFIYVQHLSRNHKSMLTDILSKATRMKVQEIDDRTLIRPDHLFVIPANKGIEVNSGYIKLIPRAAANKTITIDILFTSVARAQKDGVIGVLLSGSGTDGTRGLQDIKLAGGITFAQNHTAKVSSMPGAAIADGFVDFVLSPKEIAVELTRLSKHPFIQQPALATRGQQDPSDSNDPDLERILNQVHKAVSVDFSVYKMNTIRRRIIRRMLLYKLESLKEYSRLLEDKKEEIDILYQDLLINVTSFFRESATHKYLKDIFLPKLLKRKKQGETLRIWIPACSTGEEAYSMAMALLEIQGDAGSAIPVQIFATDLSETAIAKARIGIYTKQEVEGVTPDRLLRFFTKSEGAFRVSKPLRDLCVFAPHNILRDPPFSRLDFISCCNLFIYFDVTAQKKAVNTFHYALNTDGCLMLGKSENISHSVNLFTEFNKKYKLFSRKKMGGMRTMPALVSSPAPAAYTGNQASGIKIKKNKINVVNHTGLDQAVDAVLVSEFMPASVVINHQLEIVQFRGATELFLTHPKGKATFNILKMARPEIAFELRSAISKVIKTNERIRISGIEIKRNTAIKVISIEIVPLELEGNEPLLLILFAELEQVEARLVQNSRRGNHAMVKDQKIKKLEAQLAAAQVEFLAITEEHEAFSEELQSAHEEVVSSNEELQTVNEELETSKEEIESANEELMTTNQELQTRNELLNESYEYSEAILSTMHEPMLVLGKDLRVKSANKAFYKKFNVSQNETEGVSLYQLENKQWDIPALRELLEDIIPKNSEFYNYEVKHYFPQTGEKIMSLNASRIIQKTHREHLILLTIADITEIRNLIAEKELREKTLLLREIAERTVEKQRLETAVNQRTEELKMANDLLEEKNSALLSINKELDAFAYVSSHDLQEPLRKIQTFASRILKKEDQNLSDSGKNYFSLIQHAAERMQQLILDLLAFSRVGATERHFEEINLSMIIEEVKTEFKDVIAQKRAVIKVIESCTVKTIPFQFRQLMHNLVGNALKFSRPGVPPKITVTSRNIKYDKLHIANLIPHASYCHIKITDNGIGFEKEFSEQIFEIFQRLHDKDAYPGTGIGLAIVKKIVESHNGIITATSQLNKGSVFNIYIPASEKE